MTKREQILAAIRTALTGTTGVGTRIYRSRVEPMARQESPAIVVEPLVDKCSDDVLPKLNWELTVRVAVVVRGNVPDQLADPVIESVHSKLMNDLTLSAMIIDIIPVQHVFDTIEADQPAGVAMLDFRVRYRTSAENLSIA
jgi:hypothetical protein